MGSETYENVTSISEFSEAGRQTVNSSIASRSVRPIGNIEDEFGGNPHAQTADEQDTRMDRLYDRLLEPFDERDEREEQDRVSTSGKDENSEEATKARAASIPK